MRKDNEEMLKRFIFNSLEYQRLNDIESVIDDCIQEFNFQEVAKIFEYMNYKWAKLENHNICPTFYIPNEGDIKNESYKILYKAFAGLLCNSHDYYSVETGRFRATAIKDKDEQNNIIYECRLEFIPVAYN